MLLLALALGLAPPEGPPIQRPGDPVVWALEWEAPADCPSRAEVIARVQALVPGLDTPPLAPGRADLRVIVGVSQDAAGWTATLRTSGRDGASERRFSAPGCSELADAVALVSAVALDPVLVAREVAAQARMFGESRSEPEPEPEPAPSDESEPSPSEDPQPAIGFDLVLSEPERASPPRRVRFGVGVFGTGAYGPAATGFGGVAASFAVLGERWRWQLEGGYAIPRALSLVDGRRGRVDAWWLGSRGCVVPRLAALELPLCPGVEAGQVFARGLPPTTNITRASQPWAAIVIGQGLRWPFVERLALTLEAAVTVSLLRGRFVIGDQVLTSLTPVGFRGGLGLEARF